MPTARNSGARSALQGGGSDMRVLQPARCRAVPANEVVDVKPRDAAVLHDPLPADHHPVRPVSAAQDQGGQRVSGTGETQLVQLEKREIGDLACPDLTELRTADAGRRAFGRPA